MSNSELSCSDSSFFSSSSSFSVNAVLFPEPAVSNYSFLCWVSPAAEQSLGKGSSVLSSLNLCQFKVVGVGGGRFLSESLTSDGIVHETKRCLVQNGYEDTVVEERKKNQKIQVRKGAAVNTTKNLWAGAIAAMVSRTFVGPLERLKLEYIVRGEPKNPFDLVKTIAVSQGLRGFCKGNLLNILRPAPFKAANFCAYDTYRKQLLRFSGNEETTNFERFIAGAAAGITAPVLFLPLDTIRTKLVAPVREALRGAIGAFRHMI